MLETYKKQDEEVLRKAGEKSAKKKEDRRKLRDKFGFSDDDDEDEPEEDEGARSKKDFVTTGKFNTSSHGGSLPAVKASGGGSRI